MALPDAEREEGLLSQVSIPGVWVLGQLCSGAWSQSQGLALQELHRPWASVFLSFSAGMTLETGNILSNVMERAEHHARSLCQADPAIL